MPAHTRIQSIYMLNAALLITHEIDSAYWEEWDLIGMPGGIQLFLVLNFILVLAALIGQQRLARRERNGLYFSIGVAVVGILAAVVHTYFLSAGNPKFNTPVSMIVLGLSFLLSLVQMAWTIGALRKPSISGRQAL